MFKYHELYDLGEVNRKPIIVTLLTYIAVIITTYVFVVAPYRYDLSFIIPKAPPKEYIGDFNLSYVGKYVTGRSNEYNPNHKYFIVYKVTGKNGVAETVTLNVSKTEYNRTEITSEWQGKVSIYEKKHKKYTPYFYINKEYMEIEKYDIDSIRGEYIGGVWEDHLYSPVSVDLKYFLPVDD